MDIIDSLFEKDEFITGQQRKFIFCLIRQIYEAAEVKKKDIFGKNLDAYKDIEDIRQGLQNKFLEFEGIIPKDLEPLKGKLKVDALFQLRSFREKVDLDNMLKLTFDSMTGIVFDDDSQIYKLIAEKEIGMKRDEIHIVISEID